MLNYSDFATRSEYIITKVVQESAQYIDCFEGNTHITARESSSSENMCGIYRQCCFYADESTCLKHVHFCMMRDVIVMWQHLLPCLDSLDTAASFDVRTCYLCVNILTCSDKRGALEHCAILELLPEARVRNRERATTVTTNCPLTAWSRDISKVDTNAYPSEDSGQQYNSSKHLNISDIMAHRSQCPHRMPQ